MEIAGKAFSGFRRDLFLIFAVVIVVLSSIPIFTYQYFAADLASKERLVSYNDRGVVLFDSQNRPFFNFYQAKVKDEIPLEVIPKYTQQAVVAVEDKDFYAHQGFSLKAIIRAALSNIENNEVIYGGSTITQQLVKNSLLTPQKNFLRKYQEIILAHEIDRRYSKDEILGMYLNSVYFGEGAFGIEEAAKTYFNKKAQDLSLSQSALLVGLLPAPSKFSPLSNDLEKAKVRQKIVLEKMLEQGFISQAQMDRAFSEEIELDSTDEPVNEIGVHFALMVKQELINRFGEEELAKSGMKVYTSLDLDFQKETEKVVFEEVEKLKANRVSNGAAVVIDPKTGEIKALVGSKQWFNEEFGKVNVATSLRPPGSSFKPIVYLTAFEKGIITPVTILKDQPTTFRNDRDSVLTGQVSTSKTVSTFTDPNATYSPKNYDRRFRGNVTVRRALSNSLNVPSVEVMSKVGLTQVLEEAKELGITTLKDPSNYGLSLVLGTGEVSLLEMTSVYAAFANNGLKNNPTAILKIVDKHDEVIYEYPPKNQRVASAADVFLISSILSDEKSRAEAFGKALNISRPAAVKTGTTEDYKDAWTLGYTPSLAIGVWVGNNLNETMNQIAGSLGAAPIWRRLMEKFLAGTPIEKFVPPTDIVSRPVCIKEASGSAIEYFKIGSEPHNINCPSPESTPSAILQPFVPDEDSQYFFDDESDIEIILNNRDKKREDS